MSTYTLSLLRAGDPKMDSARLFASSIYFSRHGASNNTPPDWTILLEDVNGPCASFSIFDPTTHRPLFFSRLFENEWNDISTRAGYVAEAGALAVARSDDPIFTMHAPIILAAGLAYCMERTGYTSFVCVANRFMQRLARGIGSSCTPFGLADSSKLPVRVAEEMKEYFVAKPCGWEVLQTVDRDILQSVFLKATTLLGVDVTAFIQRTDKVTV